MRTELETILNQLLELMQKATYNEREEFCQQLRDHVCVYCGALQPTHQCYCRR